ncbi:hypothetical protein Bbelb_194510 [Branchiostoma belcheri]|nr:hypothetical protein Bbelb_194510 [Branchiostoma belcheri]
MGVVGGPYVTAIDLQFLSKPLGGPSSRHFFPSKRATYHPDFVTPACVDHEISKLEVQLQYHNKPLGGPNSTSLEFYVVRASLTAGDSLSGRWQKVTVMAGCYQGFGKL